jgi:uncharacterized protein (TIGR02996 family)
VTDEEAFQAALDANPDDHTTRLVFADWLQEQGDPRAEGYRAMGIWRRAPFYGTEGCWWWRNTRSINPLLTDISNALPQDWFDAIEANDGAFFPRAGEIHKHTNQQVKDAAALAFAKLPPERRAELLAAAGATA